MVHQFSLPLSLFVIAHSIEWIVGVQKHNLYIFKIFRFRAENLTIILKNVHISSYFVSSRRQLWSWTSSSFVHRLLWNLKSDNMLAMLSFHQLLDEHPHPVVNYSPLVTFNDFLCPTNSYWIVSVLRDVLIK